MLEDLKKKKEEEDSAPRLVGLYGEIDEESAKKLIYELMTLGDKDQELRMEEVKEKKEDKQDLIFKANVETPPIEMVVSTYGGSVHETLAIYDTMRLIKHKCEIRTLGLGKVKSAGVILLAAGTKGHRRIAKNCRVMIHDISSEQQGNMSELESHWKELKELKRIWHEVLIELTELTLESLEEILARRTDFYLSAEEAIKLGIADQIV